MVKNFSFLILLVSSSLFAKPTFVQERGDYVFERADIVDYFESQGIDYFTLKNSFVDTPYRINKRNQFQIRDWFLYNWHDLQKHFTFDKSKFHAFYGGETFNESKKNYYSQLDFNTKKFYHIENLKFFKEWGGLNHPPHLNNNKLKELSRYAKHYVPLDYNSEESKFFDSGFQRNIDQLTSSELSFGNQVSLLEDKESFEKKIKLIKKAKHTILISTLIFVCDESTKVIVNELIKKSKDGVKVYVLVDSLISKVLKHKSCPKLMQENGIHLLWANDNFKYAFGAVYHSKRIIVDLDEAIVGGQNMINADNLSNGTDFKNRDLDLYIKGPLVNDITKGFLEDYQHFYDKQLKKINKKLRSKKAKERILSEWKQNDLSHLVGTVSDRIEVERDEAHRGSAQYQEILADNEARMNGVCRVVQQAPYIDRTVIGKAYLEYMDASNNYIGIMNPEILDTKTEGFKLKRFVGKFTMYNQLHDKLMELGDKKDMHIDYVTSGPEIAGNEFVVMEHEQIKKDLEVGKIRTANYRMKKVGVLNRYFAKPHFKNILNDYAPRKNLDLWMHISFIHSKVAYFDRIVASIGSYNLHHNATDHSYEITVICQDKKLNQQMDEAFVRDMVNSVPMVFKDTVHRKSAK